MSNHIEGQRPVSRRTVLKGLGLGAVALTASGCGLSDLFGKRTATQDARATATSAASTIEALTARVGTAEAQPVATGTPAPAIEREVLGTAIADMDYQRLQTELENMPRLPITSAPLGQWFHPVFDQNAYQQSGGTDGQWSWFHTLNLQEAQGLQFRGFERNDGKFVARVNTTDSFASFAVMTSGQYKDQFMQGERDANGEEFIDGMNIRTIPGTEIEIFNPATGEVIGKQMVSQLGGDLLVQLPDNGIVGARWAIKDPNASYEAQVWFGPDDRQNSNINRFDARELNVQSK